MSLRKSSLQYKFIKTPNGNGDLMSLYPVSIGRMK